MNVRFSGGKHIHVSVKTELLKGLEKLDETVKLIKSDEYQWKWAIIVSP